MKNPFQRLSFNRSKTGQFVPDTVRAPMQSTATAAAMIPTASQVREWARSQGMNVGQRGRVSQELFQQYRSAHNGDA